MKLFQTNGPGFWSCVKDSWKNGKFKYFFHNLSCELRRGRDKECIGYKNTWWDRVLFSLGVFVMDPLGRFYKRHTNWEMKFRSDNRVWMTDTQWTRHPMPWVRRMAKNHLDWIKQQRYSKEYVSTV